jgi:uncharacterized protein YciI
MLYALICTDKPVEGLKLRQQNRERHLAWLTDLGDKMKLAGPFMNDDGSEPRGSLVVIEAESLEDAGEISASDPYAIAGVFASVDIRPWKWLFPTSS